MSLSSRYEIRVRGILDGRWTAWFDDLQVTSAGSPPDSGDELRCEYCDGSIRPGDRIRRVAEGVGWVHAGHDLDA